MPLRIETDAYSAPQGERSDCAVRALSIAADMPYADCLAAFAQYGRKPNGSTPRPVSAKLYTSLGFQQIGTLNPHRRSRRDHYITLAQFISERPTGRYIVSRRRHAFAVIDGVVHDWSTGTGPRSRVMVAWRVTR